VAQQWERMSFGSLPSPLSPSYSCHVTKLFVPQIVSAYFNLTGFLSDTESSYVVIGLGTWPLKGRRLYNRVV